MHDSVGLVTLLGVAGLMLLAGLGKFVDVPGFLRELATWTLTPRGTILAAAFLVPSIEAAVAGAVFLWPASTRPSWLLACLIVVCSVFFAIRLLIGVRPGCGCAPWADRLIGWQDGSQALLAGNGVLLAGLGLGLILSSSAGRRRSWRAFTSTVCAAESRTSRRGFTLLELVLVVALISILIVMLLPGMAGVRSRSKDAAAVSLLRSHSQVLSLYGVDYQDQFPFVLSPGEAFSEVSNPTNGFRATVPYFGTHFSWNVALATGYYDGDNRSSSFYSPDTRWPGSGFTDFFYPCAMIAHPKFWNLATRIGPSQRLSNRWSDAEHPAAKVLLLDGSRYGTDDSLNLRLNERVSFVDTSAAVLSGDAFRGAAVAGADGPWPGGMHGVGLPIGHHTIDGVRGRDLGR